MASRVDTLKIQRNAMVALHRYMICRRPNDGDKDWKSKIARVTQKGREFKINAMFRLSKHVFLSSVRSLDNGHSRNQKQSIPASVKVGIALYYMAHG